MPNAKDATALSNQRILLVGRTGSGKTSQIWTLPGRKFAYFFDPNSLASLRGCDVDYEEFYPEPLEMDATLKGFNKGARGDKPGSKLEPTLYLRWGKDLSQRVEDGFFNDYDWLIFDSLTFLARAVMARNMWINNRYGGVEELADYRIVGSKMSEVFTSIASLPLNIYSTGHIDTFQDENTKKIETKIKLPGSARDILPLVHTNIWLAFPESEGKGDKESTHFKVRTVPEPRGLQDIRTSLRGLSAVEDVTIRDFNDPTKWGIGGLLAKAK